MHRNRPSTVEQFAIQAHLNRLVGADAYDRLFLGFTCGEVIDGIVHIYAKTEYCAARIESAYAVQIATAVGSVLKQPITLVNVLPVDFSDLVTQ